MRRTSSFDSWRWGTVGDPKPVAAVLGGVETPGVEIDRRVLRRYELIDEDARLWQPGKGDLVRLRTWDIFERFLPGSGRVLDVGGGPGTHAAHLAGQGYDVTVVDPVARHVDLATRRARDPSGAPFEARLGTAADLPADDGSVLTEAEPSMLGCSAHVIGTATRP